jgi:hypothetical protein
VVLPSPYIYIGRGSKFYETRSYTKYMRPNPLRDTCTCTNFEAHVIHVLCFKISAGGTNFEAHVTHVLCFKISAGVCFKICVGARVTQMVVSHIPCIGPGLIKFASQGRGHWILLMSRKRVKTKWTQIFPKSSFPFLISILILRLKKVSFDSML